MDLRRPVFALGLFFVTAFALLAAEGQASACITGAGCSGKTPTCDLLTFSCRACQSNADCGAPFSGDVCATTGPQAGACVSAADAGARTCSQDSECDTLGGYICSGVACVLGCHITIFGDTCLVGAHCVVPNVSIGIGSCFPGPAGDGGAAVAGAGDGGKGTGSDAGAGGDASTPPCQTDADCGLSSGRVCVPGEHGNTCQPGCHDTAAGDTCPPPATCSVTGGGLGICREPGTDGGPISCTKDTDCASPGVVCVGTQCVVGCHDTSAGDTCPSGAMCSAVDGGLGLCTSSADGGSGGSSPDGGSSMPCTVDPDCNGGLVCVGLQCVVGCRDTDAGTDTCLLGTGGACSAVDAGVGECLGADGGVTPVCAQDADCAHGLVCDSSQCVVGCHDTASGGDTCDAGSTCSVTGGGLGVCVATGADGGPDACTLDGDCAQGEVCDGSRCVVGCHDTLAGGDTCTPPAHCDALGGSLGVCIGNDNGDGGAGDGSTGEESDGSLDGSSTGPDATTQADGGPAGEPTFEGGGCGCGAAPNEPAEGGGLVLLLAVTLFVRRRVSK